MFVTCAWRRLLSPIDAAHWYAVDGSVLKAWSLNARTAASYELPAGNCDSQLEAAEGSLAPHTPAIEARAPSRCAFAGRLVAHCAAEAGSLPAQVVASIGYASGGPV